MLFAVAVALPGTIRVRGIYMRLKGAGIPINRYRNPATLPGLLVELMSPLSFSSPRQPLVMWKAD
jgi:hypothetical protein